MSKLIVLALLLMSISIVPACSDDSSTTLQSTVTLQPTAATESVATESGPKAETRSRLR